MTACQQVLPKLLRALFPFGSSVSLSLDKERVGERSDSDTDLPLAPSLTKEGEKNKQGSQGLGIDNWLLIAYPHNMIFLKQVEVGLMQNFNYLIGDPETRECAWVDPAWEVDRVLKMVEGYRVTKILLTHNHFDHTEGVEAVVGETGGDVYIHPLDVDLLPKSKRKLVLVSEGMRFSIGSLGVEVLHTPGHTPGSVCYLVEGQHLFTGDTLFQGNCGRADLPGGDPRLLFKSLQRLATLDPAVKVYPGHDYGNLPVTTIGFEKDHNPAMRARGFGEFNNLP